MMTRKEPDGFAEQVPDSVVAAAKGAFERRAPGDLAVLVQDSLIDGCDPPTNHRLRFEHPSVVIEVEVSTGAGSSNLTGRVSPPAAHRAQLETDRSGASTTVSIADGVFGFEEVAPGSIRIHLQATGNDPPIHTDWFRI